MSITKSYVIQIYEPDEGMWVDCEEGRYNQTPKKLEIAMDKLKTWATYVPGVDLRLVARSEEIILEFSDDPDIGED